ncbi:hypothetical protein FXO38_35558 [Capsicum annuum]|nr:hypothetical protein FXO38_35558 [Capsicum annuum]
MMKALCYSDSPKLLLHLCRILQKALLLENLMRTHRYFEESEQHRMKHNVLVHEAAVGFIRVHSLLNLHLHWQLRVSRLAIRITARFTEILKIANVEAELTSHIYQRKDRLEHILYVTGICTDS